ncbi:hypothetical protein ARMSODRAFT_893135 [Armillaria solidipes]|uniref:Uncharacterized protein n=1 Tax=Armillaria solidipes TaxID=1076256 RepID=A0A2H3B012_9AGAR|nr:hypothetical protein ARMSODRAFT_893135 [Armillaria solidipes]
MLIFTQRIDVSWCLKRGTRIIPEGTIKGAYFVQTPDFLQVTSVGDFTQLNNHSDDAGGELDRNCSDLARNPLGDFIYSSAFGTDMRDQAFDLTVRSSTFCFRACGPAGKMAADYC